MDLTVTSKSIGAAPSTNGGLNSLNKIEASCFFERARLDVFEKVADLLMKPNMTVSGASRLCCSALYLPKSYIGGCRVISRTPRSHGLSVNGLPFFDYISELSGVARFALRWS